MRNSYLSRPVSLERMSGRIIMVIAQIEILGPWYSAIVNVSGQYLLLCLRTDRMLPRGGHLSSIVQHLNTVSQAFWVV
jgi:hypothetical protein